MTRTHTSQQRIAQLERHVADLTAENTRLWAIIHERNAQLTQLAHAIVEQANARAAGHHADLANQARPVTWGDARGHSVPNA